MSMISGALFTSVTVKMNILVLVASPSVAVIVISPATIIGPTELSSFLKKSSDFFSRVYALFYDSCFGFKFGSNS